MNDWLSRTKSLFGDEAIEKLSNCHVIVFGIGGVGGHLTEALVRCGIKKIDVVDNDKVIPSNINRQIIATTKTVGKFKVDAIEERLKEINPNCEIKKYKTFFLPETSSEFDFSKYDYIVDAIDTVKGKIELIKKANEHKKPIITALGAGNKIDPTKFEVSDIYKTSVCPLARVMRTELKKIGIKKLKVVYSKENPIKNNSKTPSSCAFCPSVMGLIMAGEVVKDLINN
ncbi:MAG: tRNA threonylcarbamoyladenosine dehydratase [Cyanobacteria bacterium SIG30]|nr:tRNA threonylcarbamoyladenosine dehydratase [Cyanobacteria bacterium SIG30]